MNTKEDKKTRWEGLIFCDFKQPTFMDGPYRNYHKPTGNEKCQSGPHPHLLARIILKIAVCQHTW